MGKNVKDFNGFVNEDLSETDWYNYKQDTSLALDDPDIDVVQISKEVMKMLDVKDATEILFNAKGDGYDDDFVFFEQNFFPKAQKDVTKNMRQEDYYVVLTKYVYKEKPIVLTVVMQKPQEHPFIFIKAEDLDFFNAEAGGKPGDIKNNEKEEVSTEEAPTEEAQKTT